MGKSVDQLNEQIAKLQRQVQQAKEKEAAGVIKRIRVAIAHYELTPEQLFGPGAGKSAHGGKRLPSRASKRSTMKVREQVPTRRATAGVKLPPKFADENGNSWTGRGSTPRWLAEAIASGKTKEDFAIKS